MPHSHGEDWIATHEAFKCSRAWDNLAFDGIQGGGGALLVEHRRCPDCGSTMSRPVDLDWASQLVSRLGAVLTVSLDAVATAARVGATSATAPPNSPSGDGTASQPTSPAPQRSHLPQAVPKAGGQRYLIRALGAQGNRAAADRSRGTPFIQAIERAAWNGLAPQLPEMARTLGASEGRAAFYVSISSACHLRRGLSTCAAH